jgi:hypothetical protein
LDEPDFRFFGHHHGEKPMHKDASYTANSNLQKNDFIELAKKYANLTHEKTHHVPFMSYWPCYSHMGRGQMHWYLYLRENLRKFEYPETDLSYIFVYLYELINQINVESPDEGFKKLVGIWVHYRERYENLDRYCTEWAVDYIEFYPCDERASFDLLKKEGLFYLIPADVLFAYHKKNDITLPVDVIARICGYNFLESKFVKDENGNLFLENLPHFIYQLKDRYEKLIKCAFKGPKRIPFQRALFYNPGHIRLKGYPAIEKFKPLRDFTTSVVKEFENQMRERFHYNGRLTYPVTLPDDIIHLCETFAQHAADGGFYGQTTEIKLDRNKLQSLMRDSDAVRKKLLEDNIEHIAEPHQNLYQAPLPPVNQPPAIPSPVINETGTVQTSAHFLPGLSAAQYNIIIFLLKNDGVSPAILSAAFPGVFVGAEIDKINEAALETINDLLIGFENDTWFIMEDYIGELP